MMTDPIADLLTRIRNGTRGRKDSVDVPWSRLKERLVCVLRDEGYLREYSLGESGGHKIMKVVLRYDEFRRPVITGIRRVSRPSLRVYVKSEEIPAIRGGLGVNVLSTP